MKKHQTFQTLFPSPKWADYKLLDSGRGRKLERFGSRTIIRPDPRVRWKPAAPDSAWAEADAEFSKERNKSGEWTKKNEIGSWSLNVLETKIHLEISPSMQIGIFPENYAHWIWISDVLSKQKSDNEDIKVLNLFGYSGVASLIAAEAGAAVTHVDSSKRALNMGKKSQELSRLSDRPIRWMLDDAVKFLQKEIRRGSQYQGLILDPPQFGRGPKREVWKFADMFQNLCYLASQVLAPEPMFAVVTAYDLDGTPEELVSDFSRIVPKKYGTLESGHLGLQDVSAGRMLQTSQFVRWSRR